MRVLQSFPHRIGAARICTTAWHQAEGVHAAGGDVRVLAGSVHRPLPTGIKAHQTLAVRGLRIPYRAIGHRRALQLHDRIVALALPKLDVDIVHCWPMGAFHTLREAKRLRIPTVLERPNAHTRYAYETVRAECDRLGVQLPASHEHAYNAQNLALEEAEYELADRLLCPSEFVERTFLDQGFQPGRLARHQYGYDHQRFYPAAERPQRDGLQVLFVGVAAVRKGLHYALDAWLASPACETGTFRIAGEFLPDYQALLADRLAHPSVQVLGHRTDVPDLLREVDVLVLPSVEEGFPLACLEAMGSGCVPVVSDVCRGVCVDGVNALVHQVGDVRKLTSDLTALHQDRGLLRRLRDQTLLTARDYTWTRAGERLLDVYLEVVDAHDARFSEDGWWHYETALR